MIIRKLLFRLLILFCFLPALLTIASYINYHFISFSSGDRIYSDIRRIPFRSITLLPGSGRIENEKWTNHTLIHRLNAAKKLYLKHKTFKIVASGVRKNEENDETRDMRTYLIENGVSELHIVTDNNGIRTWESVSEILKNFPGEKIIIVSQREHLERALFIAGCLNVDAIGFAANSTPYQHKYWSVRENLARLKCTFDCVMHKIRS